MCMFLEAHINLLKYTLDIYIFKYFEQPLLLTFVSFKLWC